MRLAPLLTELLFAGEGYGAFSKNYCFLLVEMALLTESEYCRPFDKMTTEDQDLLAAVPWPRQNGEKHDNNRNFLGS
jgi:hypothetical protein